MNAAAVLCLALGGLVWVEETIPDLRVRDTGFTADLSANYRHADIDGDGETDLVLPTRVLFQRAGRFSESAPLPGIAEGTRPHADLWEADLYLWGNNTLEIWRWQEGAWTRHLAQPLLHDEPPANGARGWEVEDGVVWSRFLHDLDDDGAPEIVAGTPEGLRVHARRDAQFEEAGLLEVYPPPRLAPRAPGPSDALRGALFPGDSMQCTVFLDGSALTVVERQPAGTYAMRFHVRTMRIARGEDSRFVVEETGQHTTKPLPWRTEPCRLNDDDVLDFAVAYAGGSETLPLPLPVTGAEASTDGGRTLQSVRAIGLGGRGPFIDMDGDGDRDMVIQETDFFHGGLREVVNRAMTSRSVRHTVSLHLQDDQGRFSTRRDAKWEGVIGFRSPLWKRGPRFDAYLYGELVDVTGDFNGDGRNDVAVHDRPDRLAVYLWDGDGFASRPLVPTQLGEQDLFTVVDVDGDGRSDVVVYPAPNGRAVEPRARVFLTREDKP